MVQEHILNLAEACAPEAGLEGLRALATHLSLVISGGSHLLRFRPWNAGDYSARELSWLAFLRAYNRDAYAHYFMVKNLTAKIDRIKAKHETLH